MSGEHIEAAPRGGPDDGAESVAFDWWHAFDIAVWAAALVIVALGLEWAFGRVVRERVADGASRYLDRVRPGTTSE